MPTKIENVLFVKMFGSSTVEGSLGYPNMERAVPEELPFEKAGFRFADSPPETERATARVMQQALAKTMLGEVLDENGFVHKFDPKPLSRAEEQSILGSFDLQKIIGDKELDLFADEMSNAIISSVAPPTANTADEETHAPLRMSKEYAGWLRSHPDPSDRLLMECFKSNDPDDARRRWQKWKEVA